MRSRVLNALSCSVAAAALVACSGGGGSDPVPSVPTQPKLEGLFAGGLTGDPAANHIEFLVLDNGQTWAYYGNLSGGTFRIASFLQGGTAAANLRVRGPDLRDFIAAPVVVRQLDGAYNTDATTLDGTLVGGGATWTFSTKDSGQSAFQGYDYDAAPDPALVRGDWSFPILGAGGTVAQTVDMKVADDGNFTFKVGSGCTGSGSITPRPGGKNVFNVQMTWDASCFESAQSLALTGVALAYRTNGGPTEVTMAVVDGTRQYGLPLIASR